MAKPIAKITVRCPHCGAQQQEPELAKSTFCRRCSEYFAITAASLGGAVAPARPAAGATSSWAKAAPAHAAEEKHEAVAAKSPVGFRPPELRPVAAGFRQKIEGLLGGKPKTLTAHCFECTSWHEVSSTASSTTCKACGAYVDLQDYKITGSFSRNIKTRGTLYLGSKGDLSSSKVVCAQATLHGKMRGNLACPGKVIVRVQGRLFGSVEAGMLLVEKGSDVAFSRTIRAGSVEVHGKMSGDILSETHVTIYRTGFLEGAVTATGFTVEKGGCFQGELTISPRHAPDVAADAVAELAAKLTVAVQLPNGGLLGGEQKPALG